MTEARDRQPAETREEAREERDRWTDRADGYDREAGWADRQPDAEPDDRGGEELAEYNTSEPDAPGDADRDAAELADREPGGTDADTAAALARSDTDPGVEAPDAAGNVAADPDALGSDPDRSDLRGSDPDRSDPDRSDLAGSDLAGSDPDRSDLRGSDPAGSDPAAYRDGYRSDPMAGRAGADGQVGRTAGPVDDAGGLMIRWQEVQTSFVDDPRQALQAADGLVQEVLRQVHDRLTGERSSLEGQWSRGEEVSTEELRQALQQYRSFFNRLLQV